MTGLPKGDLAFGSIEEAPKVRQDSIEDGWLHLQRQADNVQLIAQLSIHIDHQNTLALPAGVDMYITGAHGCLVEIDVMEPGDVEHNAHGLQGRHQIGIGGALVVVPGNEIGHGDTDIEFVGTDDRCHCRPLPEMKGADRTT